MLGLGYETLSLIVGMLFILMLVITVIYFSIKDRDSAKKIHQLENSIEDANKEIYKIQKWILDKDSHQHDVGAELNHKLDLRTQEIFETITLLKSDISSINHGLQSDREYFEDKIIVLEEKIRELVNFGHQVSNINEKHILDMFSNNYSIDRIAKELRIGRGEVEFVLRLAELKGEH